MPTVAPDFNPAAADVDYGNLQDQLTGYLTDQTNPTNIAEAKRLIMEFAHMADDPSYKPDLDGRENAALCLIDVSHNILNAPFSDYLTPKVLHEFDEFCEAKNGDKTNFYILASTVAEEKVQQPLDRLVYDNQPVDLDAINAARKQAIALARLSDFQEDGTLDIRNKNELIESLNLCRYGKEEPPAEYVLTTEAFDALWVSDETVTAPEDALSQIHQEKYAARTIDGVDIPEITWTQIGTWLCEGLDKTLELARQATPTSAPPPPAAAPAPGSAS